MDKHCIVVTLMLGLSMVQGTDQFYKKKLTGMSGVLSTPNYPDKYPANVDVLWEIAREPEANCVVFTVEDFDVPSEDEILCPGDHFSLDSCGSWLDVSPERYFCGNYTQEIATNGPKKFVQHFQTNATSLTVSFHSDSFNEGRGVLIQYQLYDQSTCNLEYDGLVVSRMPDDNSLCVDILTKSFGSFQTPGFPRVPYPNNLDCLTIIERVSDQYCGVILRTRKFDLEPRDGYGCYDFFKAPGCRSTCGNGGHDWFFEFQPGSDAIVLRFGSDYDTPGRGYNIDYKQVTDCFKPHQPECPNDHLTRNSFFGECVDTKNRCDANRDCAYPKICCFDGCSRQCKMPVKSKPVKRDIRIVEDRQLN